MGNAVKHLEPPKLQPSELPFHDLWGPFPNPEFIVRLCELCDTRRRVRAAIPHPRTHGHARVARSGFAEDSIPRYDPENRDTWEKATRTVITRLIATKCTVPHKPLPWKQASLHCARTLNSW